MKKALILGIGSAQVDLIRYLKAAGWWVIGCSYCCCGPGLRLVDQFELIDIKDCAALEELGHKERVAMLYSVGSDLAALSGARIAPRLGLPSFTCLETVELLHNKARLREFLAANDLGSVRYQVVRTVDDLQGWDHFPAIVKPVDSQGQRGVFSANSLQEIKTGLARSAGFSESNTVLVEEYLGGPEISVNVLVKDSRVVFSQISDRHVVEGYPGGIARAHVFPSEVCTGQAAFEVQDLVERCIQALAIENGPVYFQIKLSDRGPRVIEITPRLDGCHIWHLIKTASGVDLLDASIRLLTGDSRSITLQVSQNINRHHLNFLLSPPGRIFRAADHSPPVNPIYLEYYYEDGETIRPINGFIEKVGYYIEREPVAKHWLYLQPYIGVEGVDVCV